MTTEREHKLERRIEELEVAYQELQKTKRLLGARTAVAWMGMVSSVWAHSVKGHAAMIRDGLELLRRLIATNAPVEKIERIIAQLDEAAISILDIPMTAPLSSEESIEVFSVNPLLREQVERLCKRHRDVQTVWKLVSDDAVAVRASRAWLQRVIDIVVKNALEAMSQSTTKILKISSGVAGHTVEIRVSDTGHGVPHEVVTSLFKEPIKTVDKKMGMGLLLASTIVQTYGGDIKLTSTGPDGTTFVISLPRPE